jgi:hypothetical protein
MRPSFVGFYRLTTSTGSRPEAHRLRFGLFPVYSSLRVSGHGERRLRSSVIDVYIVLRKVGPPDAGKATVFDQKGR